MGANLDQALTAVNILVPNDYDDSNSTHPTRNKRISAITNGFNGSNIDIIDNNDLTASLNSIELSYNKAISKVSMANIKYASNDDIVNAIGLHENIINKKEFGPSLLILSLLYGELLDRNLLDIDYYLTKINYAERANSIHYKINGVGSFELYNNIGYAYNFLALEYKNRSYFNKAIENLNYSININPSIPIAYHNRGVAYWNLGNNFNAYTKPKACQDFYNSCYLGRQEACDIYNRACR